eukprot:s7596_g1.t1
MASTRKSGKAWFWPRKGAVPPMETAVLALLNGQPPPIEATAQDREGRCCGTPAICFAHAAESAAGVLMGASCRCQDVVKLFTVRTPQSFCLRLAQGVLAKFDRVWFNASWKF